MSNRKRPRGRPSKYPPEFQRDAVAMVLDEGRAIAEVARAIGVNEGTLGTGSLASVGRGPEPIRSRLTSGSSWLSCGRRTPSCGWSVICSNDRWPSG